MSKFYRNFCLFSCPLTPVVSKASAGAMELVPVYKLNDITGLLKV